MKGRYIRTRILAQNAQEMLENVYIKYAAAEKNKRVRIHTGTQECTFYRYVFSENDHFCFILLSPTFN